MSTLPVSTLKAPVAPRRAIQLWGMPFDAVNESACIDRVLHGLQSGIGGWIVTANLDHLRRFVLDPSYEALCSCADMIVADGRPILWAAAVQGTPLPGVVAGSNLIITLTQALARRSQSVYLLGGDPGTAAGTARELRSRFPSIRIVGLECPPVGFDRDEEAVAVLRDRLIDAEPDVVYVALGSPKQERLIWRLKDSVPGSWWIGVGKSFSFLSGDTRRAPQWVQRLGAEWMFRLAQEPRRLFTRYVVQCIPFAIRLFLHAATVRSTRVESDQPSPPDRARSRVLR